MYDYFANLINAPAGAEPLLVVGCVVVISLSVVVVIKLLFDIFSKLLGGLKNGL